MNEIQRKELEVFKEVKKVIERHGLQYFAIGGTCIGAIRHGGFIPWDDDIDIAMPRVDYERLRTEYYKELPDYLQKLDGDNCKSHNYLFFKIHDARTTYVEYNHALSPDRYSGVFVDIMPIDGVPTDGFEKYYRIINKYSYLNNLNRPWPHKNENIIEYIKSFGKKCLQIFFKYNYFFKKLNAFVANYAFDASDNVFFTWRNEKDLSRKLFRREWFKQGLEVAFEDTTIMVPEGYDAYLSQDYGDYKKLPPKEEQKSIHSVYISDINRPCSYYAELKRKGELK